MSHEVVELVFVPVQGAFLEPVASLRVKKAPNCILDRFILHEPTAVPGIVIALGVCLLQAPELGLRNRLPTRPEGHLFRFGERPES